MPVLSKLPKITFPKVSSGFHTSTFLLSANSFSFSSRHFRPLWLSCIWALFRASLLILVDDFRRTEPSKKFKWALLEACAAAEEEDDIAPIIFFCQRQKNAFGTKKADFFHNNMAFFRYLPSAFIISFARNHFLIFDLCWVESCFIFFLSELEKGMHIEK